MCLEVQITGFDNYAEQGMNKFVGPSVKGQPVTFKK
jgi:hypothetical protein